MEYDVIIIGSGAGGGTLAHALAEMGAKILILERGQYLRREKENWNAHAVFSEQRYTADEQWTDKAGKPFRPGIHYYVGGNTKFYGAALLRMRKSDFGRVQHHGGLSPEWPITYEDLEPYYTRAEHLYRVHGEHGVDPTEPEASAPYLYPPVTHEPRIAELARDLERLGLHPFPLPVGVRLNEADFERSRCVRCSTCDGFPCLVDAKADAHTICIRPLSEKPNATILTGAFVKRLETSPSGREVASVVVERDGAEERHTSAVVVASCGAVNSAALLLRSANEKHPAGLANGSGVVGRHYMAHNNSAFVAVSKRENHTVFQKTLGVNDYYHRSDDFEFPLGHFQMLGKSEAEEFRGDAPLAPEFALRDLATHALDFWLTSEDLPDPDNRVTLNRDGSISLSYTPNNLAGHTRLVAKLKDSLEHIGCEPHLLPNALYLGKKIPIAGVAHQNGTIRFGTDPATSALDADCKAHELDNLYVVDGSFFVSSSAVNPGLTIMANALRVAERIGSRLGSAAAPK